jgi:alpha-amylase/alpha-mannosidase (GH57 family)
MNRIHLVLLWHMHQPQYRDPETGRYVLPWTRLHALKDYWGMVRVLQEAPRFHATFNVVPSLGMQIEEYASGRFDEPWYALAFKKTDELSRVSAESRKVVVSMAAVRRVAGMVTARRWRSGSRDLHTTRLARPSSTFSTCMDG